MAQLISTNKKTACEQLYLGKLKRNVKIAIMILAQTIFSYFVSFVDINRVELIPFKKHSTIYLDKSRKKWPNLP